MLRKSLLGLAGLAALTATVVTPWLKDDSGTPTGAPAAVITRDAIAHALERSAAARTLGAPDRREASALALPGDAHAVGRTHDLAELAGATDAAFAPTATHATLTPDEQKQVDKLDKKLVKAQSKFEKQELKLANIGNDIDAAQNALDDANALPEGTEKEIKAKANALAKALKKIARLEAKLAKAQIKLDVLDTSVEDLTASITTIDPEHFADIAGLQAPEQMSVVTADEGEGGGGGSGFFGGGDFLLGGGDFPLLSDYNQDPQNKFVFDPSMDTLGTVNMILCLLAQTVYDELVNEGTYIAQVDESLCESGGDNSSSTSSTGQSSGGNAEAPSLWVVKSTRPTEDGAQTVKVWVPQEADGGGGGGGGPSTIRVKMDVTQGISDSDPFGKFDLNFAQVPLGGDLQDTTNFGNLRTLDVLDGFIGFAFFESAGDLNQEPFPQGEFAQVVQANVNMFDDQSEGVARIRRQFRENFGPEGDSGIQTDEYLLAFNAATVLRGKNGEQGTCLSRTDFAERVFRYGLYYAQGDDLGARVERNGGFGFQTAGGKYGWIGYYGLWAPPDVDIESGDTVTKAQFGDAEPETFTVVSAPGKLIRNTQQQLPLAEADGEQFTWWDFPSFGPPPMGGGEEPPPEGGGGDPPPEGGGGDPPPGGGGGGDPQGGEPPVQYRVAYDDASGEFRKVATFDMSTGTFTDLQTPEVIDIEAEGNFLQMFSDSLGGSVSYVNGEETLTYFTTQFVTGSDEFFAGGDDVVLFGFQDCLESGITGAEAEDGDIFLENVNDVASPHRFVFRKSDLTLYHDADGTGANLVQVGLADGEEPTSGPFTWGMRSGPMLTSTDGLMSTYETFNQPVFFSYETGHNNWNKYQSLVDAQGLFVSFDPPLQFTYEHSLENDRSADAAFAGKKFLLNYNGFGDLFGIPGQPFDLDGDGNPDRYYPVFSINDGVLCGESGTEYVLKAIDVELSLQEAGPGDCSMQTIDPVGSLELPDETYYTAPDIGPKPVVSDPPAVVNSEIVKSEAP